MELVFAILALHRGQRFVALMQDTVTDKTLLDTFHLFIDVCLPEKNRSDDVPVAGLEQVSDRKSPSPYLGLLQL